MGTGVYTPADANMAGKSRMLFSLVGANMNSTADQTMVATFSFNSYVIDKIIVTNQSGSLALAVGGIYTGAGKSGVAVVAAAQAYSALTTAIKVLNPTIAISDRRTEALILALTTAAGSAATADFYVIGTALS